MGLLWCLARSNLGAWFPDWGGEWRSEGCRSEAVGKKSGWEGRLQSEIAMSEREGGTGPSHAPTEVPSEVLIDA